MLDGIVPGNRNADNVDEDLKRFENIVFPSKSLHTGLIKAALLKSFGFGQVCGGGGGVAEGVVWMCWVPVGQVLSAQLLVLLCHFAELCSYNTYEDLTF